MYDVFLNHNLVISTLGKFKKSKNVNEETEQIRKVTF